MDWIIYFYLFAYVVFSISCQYSLCLFRGADVFLDRLIGQAKALPVLQQTHRTQWKFDPFLIVSNQVSVKDTHEYFYGDSGPWSIGEISFLSLSKNPSQAALSGEQPFLDIDLSRPASFIRDIHPGQR